ncbi:hypothetical protein BpHYR1_036177 [Brachionus plicatilis]|uniref:Uncharacterized protein n=1 Tax=Brachionus plicatilis TaxID=10195 RepID=A0A3M7QI71_BRAPC|nr:hypothetical protein BpHYR1_036177 [Brachionus plicatilis]
MEYEIITKKGKVYIVARTCASVALFDHILQLEFDILYYEKKTHNTRKKKNAQKTLKERRSSSAFFTPPNGLSICHNIIILGDSYMGLSLKRNFDREP